MELNRFEFEVLAYLESHENTVCDFRKIANNLYISVSTVEEIINSLKQRYLIEENNNKLSITNEGIISLEPYRVKRAIIVAAGFGSRMMPATSDRPKPMVTVNGTRIIDTLLDALVSVGINDIIVVGGYHFERLTELTDKYPFLKFLNNKKYDKENNISSALLAKDYFIGGCYFCEADLYISNPDIIKKYQYKTNILGSWSLETDDWCFEMENGYVSDYKKGGRFCYNYYGISYWTDEDSRKLIEDWAELYNTKDGKDLFWEFPAFIHRKEKYKVEIRPCNKNDIIEIDNYYELEQLDTKYCISKK